MKSLDILRKDLASNEEVYLQHLSDNASDFYMPWSGRWSNALDTHYNGAAHYACSAYLFIAPKGILAEGVIKKEGRYNGIKKLIR